jgi:methionyl-tRNA formyltransferase
VPESVQPDAGVTYAAKIEKAEAEIDWQQPAAAIERRVRAFYPWPIAQTRLDAQQLRIWEAEVPQAGGTHGQPGAVLAQAPGGVDVACGEGILRLTRLQSPGQPPKSVAQFIQAHSLLNARLGP